MDIISEVSYKKLLPMSNCALQKEIFKMQCIQYAYYITKCVCVCVRVQRKFHVMSVHSLKLTWHFQNFADPLWVLGVHLSFQWADEKKIHVKWQIGQLEKREMEAATLFLSVFFVPNLLISQMHDSFMLSLFKFWLCTVTDSSKKSRYKRLESQSNVKKGIRF